MKQGDVIGLLTLSGEHRNFTASSYKTSGKEKSQLKTIKNQFGSLPGWLKIVINEYVTRLDTINTKYKATFKENLQLKTTQLSYLYLTRQIWNCFAFCRQNGN